MELKRIIARDSRSANEKAIQMYGQDVLIISSHKVDNQIELVVAVETAPAAPSPVVDNAFKPLSVQGEATASVQQVPAAQAFSRVFEEHMVSPAADPSANIQAPSEHDMVMDALTALSRRVVSQPVELAPAASATAAPAALAAPSQLEAPVTAHVTPPVAASLAKPAAAPAAADMVHDFRRSQETVELLRQEMSALRQEFALSRQMAVWQGGLGLAPKLNSCGTSCWSWACRPGCALCCSTVSAP